MTPQLTFRTFTNDQYILDKVFYRNFYKLRAFPANERKPVVVDLGAHCGYFTFVALSVGAKKVYAFEPFVPNYRMLMENVGGNPISTVIPYQLGVYVAPVALTFGYPPLLNKSYFDFSNIHSDVNVDSVDFCKCCMLPLDTLLEHYIGEQVDILKINIGYGEMAIISASQLLTERVANICGEIALNTEGQEKFRGLLAQKGYLHVNMTPVEGEEHKILFHASRADLKEMFL